MAGVSVLVVVVAVIAAVAGVGWMGFNRKVPEQAAGHEPASTGAPPETDDLARGVDRPADPNAEAMGRSWATPASRANDR